ncbi:hypothetical protein BB559_003901 [Furculomyces boomerangus]|uniref:Prokaryotic-type class I peptide chain release factors domain-containing protein n=1 Tax=Furculomyces boomerangus TaxID=61424 RepID=A0A2T9YI48_9FUNG|nr:hypothetical protein BB559_003901 [Furculomyces boomerangus]
MLKSNLFYQIFKTKPSIFSNSFQAFSKPSKSSNIWNILNGYQKNQRSFYASNGYKADPETRFDIFSKSDSELDADAKNYDWKNELKILEKEMKSYIEKKQDSEPVNKSEEQLEKENRIELYTRTLPKNTKKYIVSLKETDLIEKFTKGSGHGGQKINKTNNCIHLLHKPTSLAVICQDTRSLETNRKIARKRLLLKVDCLVNKDNSTLSQKIIKIREKKRKKRQKSAKKYAKKDPKLETEKQDI